MNSIGALSGCDIIALEVNISIDKMTTEEKIRTMEVLWDDLCRNAAEIPSPSWHNDILLQREGLVSEGKETFTDWENAKKSICEKLSL